MADFFDKNARSAIRTALTRASYDNDTLRMADPELRGARWLVTTQTGLFAVNDRSAHVLAYGSFFGLCRRGDQIFMFENCARREYSLPMGRLIAVDLVDGMLTNPRVLAKQLNARCHQIAFVDDLLCVMDTANQRVLRFTDQGEPVDVKCPFPLAQARDNSGKYMHINSIAAVPDGIAIMAHNEKMVPQRPSEIILLDRQWNEIRRVSLSGTGCHDIVQDGEGLLWHCASMTGEIVCSDGRRLQVTPDRMTRGLAIGEDGILVGASIFGPRSIRDHLPGSVILLDRSFNQVAEMQVEGPPAVIMAL